MAVHAAVGMKYEWINALKWLRGDTIAPCKGPLPLPLSLPEMTKSDAEHAVKDISTIDLPFARARRLLFTLDRFRCLGLKKGRDARLYMMFQLEMYAWKSKTTVDHHKSKLRLRPSRNQDQERLRLDRLHGLDFNSTLRRLCLVRYGKDSSLSYADQMEEYELEKATVAVHIIQTFCLAWLMSRRVSYSGQNTRISVHALWRKDRSMDGDISPCYLVAVRGVRDSRALALKRLDALVEQNNPDVLYGRWSPAHSMLSETREERRIREKAEQRDASIRKKQEDFRKMMERIPQSEQNQRDRAMRTLNKRKAITEFDDSDFMYSWHKNNEDWLRLLEELVLKIQRAYRRRLIRRLALQAVLDARAAEASRIAAEQRAERARKAEEARVLAEQQGVSLSAIPDQEQEGQSVVVEFEGYGKLGCARTHLYRPCIWLIHRRASILIAHILLSFVLALHHILQ